MTTNGFHLDLRTRPGRAYSLEFKSSLADESWTPLPLLAGTGGVVRFTDANPQQAERFYRVRRW